MLELTEGKVARWGRTIGAPTARLAEQDYRLVDLLRAIGEDAFLRKLLAFKGGTALNKLYFRDQARLSVDLDFNAIGTKGAVEGHRQALRKSLVGLFEAQDPDFAIAYSNKRDLVRVTGRYQPFAGGGQEKIKLEVSMIERFPLTDFSVQTLPLPDGDDAKVRTYPIDELVATKLRAFYSRRGGRDVFDLQRARPLLRQPVSVRKMAEYYFYRARILYDPDEVRGAFAPEQERAFRIDLDPYVRASDSFNLTRSLQELPGEYAFLFDQDDRDAEFLLLAAHLLGRIGAKRAAPVLGIEQPLARLFEGQEGLSPEAGSATLDDIRVRSRGQDYREAI